MGNPVIKKIKDYRKILTVRIVILRKSYELLNYMKLFIFERKILLILMIDLYFQEIELVLKLGQKVVFKLNVKRDKDGKIQIEKELWTV